jgi:hypothetical protein
VLTARTDHHDAAGTVDLLRRTFDATVISERNLTSTAPLDTVDDSVGPLGCDECRQPCMTTDGYRPLCVRCYATHEKGRP